MGDPSRGASLTQATLDQVKVEDPGPGLKRCPSCSHVVPDAKVCIWCGHWLGTVKIA